MDHVLHGTGMLSKLQLLPITFHLKQLGTCKMFTENLNTKQMYVEESFCYSERHEICNNEPL